MAITNPTCFKLEVHRIRTALFFACANAGRSNAARMAMIAITTSNSIKVKALGLLRHELFSHHRVMLLAFLKLLSNS
jgi:hypothetical protein